MTNALEWLLAALVMLLGTLGTTSEVAVPPAVVNPPAVSGNANPAPPMQAHADVQSTLTTFLSLVPWTEDMRGFVTFGDIASWYETTGMTRLTFFDQYLTLPDKWREAWMLGLPGETMPPNALGLQYLAMDSMREAYGFSFFDALQTLEAGNPPDALTIVRVDSSPALIHIALVAKGYTVEETPAGTLYSVRGDYEMDLGGGDVFARLAQLNRIFVFDSDDDATILLIGRATQVINDALAAHTDTATALLDDPFVAAVAQEIEAFAAPGALTGAIFMGGPMPGDPMAALGQRGEELQDALRRYGQEPLNQWVQAAFTHHRAGDDLYMSVFLAFTPGVDAQLNAERLAARMEEYPVIAGRVPADEAWTLHALGAGGSADVPIAWVTMQVDEARVNREHWINEVVRRDQLYLMPGVPLVAD